MPETTKQLRHTAEQVDALLDLVPQDHAVSVATTAWSGSGPYTATVSAPGITAASVIVDAVPDVDGLSGSGLTDALAAAAAWTTVETGSNVLIFRADTKPTTTLKLIVRARG